MDNSWKFVFISLTYNYRLIIHEFSMNLFNHEFTSVVDVQSGLGGLAAELAAVEAKPAVSHRLSVFNRMDARILVPKHHCQLSSLGHVVASLACGCSEPEAQVGVGVDCEPGLAVSPEPVDVLSTFIT